MSRKEFSDKREELQMLIAGSEEDYDYVCDFCQTEGKRVEAVEYCNECIEYLCNGCKTTHKRTSATRGHVLQDVSTAPTLKMRRRQTKGSFNASDPLVDKCKKHPDELIKLYCNSHRQLGCHICIALHHKHCDDVSYISDVSGGIAGSQELSTLQTDLTILAARLECGKSRSEWCQREADDSYKQLVADVKIFRDNHNKRLDKLEGELLEKASFAKGKTLAFLSNRAERYESLCKEIKTIELGLKNTVSLKQFNKLYIAMRSAQEKLQDVKKETVDIGQTIKTKQFLFKPDNKLNDITSSVTSIGTMSVIEKSANVRAKYTHSINIKSAKDGDGCNITGIVILPDRRLAVSDFINKSVKIIDTADGGKVTEMISLTAQPRDITLCEGDQLAVTLKGTNYIHLLSLSPKLALIKTITMPGYYNGITYSDGKMILASYQPSAIHICDMSGNLIKSIDQTNAGKKLFRGAPSRITTSPDQGIIYVSDFKKNRVVSISRSGVIMSACFNDKLNWPVGIAVDDCGLVYVCSTDSHTVHQLTSSGQHIKVLLKEKDKLSFPDALTHNAGHLYVSSHSAVPACCNYIKVFKLE